MATHSELVEKAMIHLESLSFFEHPLIYQQCFQALDELNQRLDSVDQCLLIFRTILDQQLPKGDALLRTFIELHYEMWVADRGGNRTHVANVAIQHPSDLYSTTDELLDIYNERVMRFSNYFCILGHPHVAPSSNAFQLQGSQIRFKAFIS